VSIYLLQCPIPFFLVGDRKGRGEGRRGGERKGIIIRGNGRCDRSNLLMKESKLSSLLSSILLLF